MNHTCSTTYSTCNDSLVSILLSLHLQRRIKCYCTKPVVAVVIAISRLTMHSHTLNTCQQLLIEFLHMLMMSDMIIYHSHLATTYTCTDVTHTIVVANLLMLIVWIAFTILGGIHHNLAPSILIRRNQRTTTTGCYHLISIKAKHTILTECTQHLTLILRTESFSRILNHRNIIAISNLHDAVNLVRHTIQRHWYNSLWLLTRLSDTVFDSLLQQIRIHIPSITLRIHEHRCRSQISNWV